jgi:hypothetical protein
VACLALVESQPGQGMSFAIDRDLGSVDEASGVLRGTDVWLHPDGGGGSMSASKPAHGCWILPLISHCFTVMFFTQSRESQQSSFLYILVNAQILAPYLPTSGRLHCIGLSNRHCFPNAQMLLSLRRSQVASDGLVYFV